MEMDGRSSDDRDLDGSVADPSQFLPDLPHVLPYLGQGDGRVGTDRDAHPAVPPTGAGQPPE